MDQLFVMGLLAAFVIFWYVIAPRVPGLSKFT